MKSEPFETFGDVLNVYGSKNWVKKLKRKKKTKGLIDVLHIFDVITCAQGQFKRQIIKS